NRRSLPPARSALASDAPDGPSPELRPYQIVSRSELLDRYLLRTDGTGNAVRLSHKVFDLLACSRWDADCRLQVEALKARLASPALANACDFSGLLEVLQQLQENN
ncbi:MAG TPA: hypothetical protein VHK69_12170, partial [Chitinophagaceae bacterium]|nr:hypothetical protein [Chitinophagaceae bacterium]